MNKYKILTINPGSTSTKIGLFEGEKCLFSANVSHEAEILAGFPAISDQLDYRRETIYGILTQNDVDLSEIDAVVGRGGGLMAVDGGVYEVNEILLEHARTGANGVQHPANLGSLLANEFASAFNKKAFVVNPPDTDELCDLARVTGIKGVYRNVHLHALNLKETAIRHAALRGQKYEEQNYVVCHIGGGISISAHQKGKMIDGNDIVGGEGPMAPTRSGSVPVAELLKYIKDKEIKEVRSLCTKTGGFVSLLGTSDAKEVFKRAENGDTNAARAWNAMIYQIIKYIGAMSAVLHGEVDGILLSGGMVHNKDLVNQITAACSYIADVYAYPGEFELEAMSAGAIRVLSGLEEAKKYTGISRWHGFGE